MGKLLFDYDMENTILLEVRKIKAIAEAMRLCNFDFLDNTIIPFIGKVILDYLENINKHIKNDCIFQNEEEGERLWT